MDSHVEQDLWLLPHIHLKTEVFAQRDNIVLQQQLVHRTVEMENTIQIKEDLLVITVQPVDFALDFNNRRLQIVQLAHIALQRLQQLLMN